MSGTASSVLLFILNIIHVVFGLGMACVAIWFYIEVTSITNLRNANHYLLDYQVYWPQAIPWVFIIVGLFVVCVSGCGLAGAKKKSKGFLVMFMIFEVAAIVALVAAAGIALSLADTERSDRFIADTIWDVYTTMKDNRDIEKAFGDMEKRFQCCGASGPRDYKNWRDDFPISCCDTYYHGWIGNYAIDCSITNKLANERHGCTEVAKNYARIIIKVLSGAAVFTAFIGILNVIAGIILIKIINSKKRSKLPVQQESESKKVLL